MIINLQRHDFKVKYKPRREIPVATWTAICKKKAAEILKKNKVHQYDKSVKGIGQDDLSKTKFFCAIRTSGVWKNKVNLENKCKESSDTEEKSFQASAKIYGSDNDVMGSLRIKHTSPVSNVHERQNMVRICWWFLSF